MKKFVDEILKKTDVISEKYNDISNMKIDSNDLTNKLKKSIHATLETYSNVHRGSGHFSMVTTRLFDQSREKILEYLGLEKGKYLVIFCNPRQADELKSKLVPGSYLSLSSKEIGLSLGVRTIVVKRNALPKNMELETGGGTARLVGSNWVVKTRNEAKFEPGTPPIVNIIAFAKALQLLKNMGLKSFDSLVDKEYSVHDILYADDLMDYTGQELLNKLKQTLIGRNVMVPTSDGEKSFVNFDNAASTPTFESIFNTFYRSLFTPDKIKTEIRKEAKSICSGFLNAQSSEYDIFFTSNTTESINLLAKSIGGINYGEIEPVIINTLLEHNSNELPWRLLSGHFMVRMPVDMNGFIDINELEKLFISYNKKGEHGKKRIKLMALTAASNVLDVYNDITKISSIVHKYGAHLMVDAAQMVAHRKIDISSMGIDFLVFSAHKMHAPFGSGALIARKTLLNFTTEQRHKIEVSGEENAAGISAMAKAMLMLDRIGMDVIQQEETEITKYALDKMVQLSDYNVFGITDTGSPEMENKGGIIIFSHKKIMAHGIAKKLAYFSGIGIRSGCHCSHMLIKKILGVSPGLERFQRVIVSLFPKVELPGAARISFGISNTKNEVDVFINTLQSIASEANNRGGKVDYKISFSDVKKKIQSFINSASLKVFG